MQLRVRVGTQGLLLLAALILATTAPAAPPPAEAARAKEELRQVLRASADTAHGARLFGICNGVVQCRKLEPDCISLDRLAQMDMEEISGHSLDTVVYSHS